MVLRVFGQDTRCSCPGLFKDDVGDALVVVGLSQIEASCMLQFEYEYLWIVREREQGDRHR